MNKRFAYLVLAIIALFFLGLFALVARQNTKATPTPAPIATIAPLPTVMVTPPPAATTSALLNGQLIVNLSPQESTESGQAILREVNGKTVATLSLSGAPRGVSQPAHIHIGSCPKPGAIKYPLKNVLNGSSETTLNIKLDDLKEFLPLAINVHKSVSQSSVYVSCGNVYF